MCIDGNESIDENENFLLFNINIPLHFIGIDLQTLNNKQFNLNPSLFRNNDIANTNFPNCSLNINNNEGISTELGSKQNNNEPLLYSFDDILNIFKKEENEKKFNDIINKFNKEVVRRQMKFLEKKRQRFLYDEDYNYIYQLIEKGKPNENKIIENKQNNNKKGRKKKGTENIGIHNKMVSDNIIKKIKSKIFEYSISFLNNILNNNHAKDKIFKIDYKFINRLNREQDLKFLDMRLKDLFSKEISPKYLTNNKRGVYHNKNYISKILKNQKDKTILFAFNITFRDWLELFTLKKNIYEIIIKYDYLEQDINYEKIKISLYDVNNLFKKIISENKSDNDNEYLSMFIFLLYNYERWFYNKKGRKTSNKKLEISRKKPII